MSLVGRVTPDLVGLAMGMGLRALWGITWVQQHPSVNGVARIGLGAGALAVEAFTDRVPSDITYAVAVSAIALESQQITSALTGGGASQVLGFTVRRSASSDPSADPADVVPESAMEVQSPQRLAAFVPRRSGPPLPPQLASAQARPGAPSGTPGLDLTQLPPAPHSAGMTCGQCGVSHRPMAATTAYSGDGDQVHAFRAFGMVMPSLAPADVPRY